MIETDRQIVLDTWVLVQLCRGGEIGRAIAARYQLRQRTLTPVISIVTVGEMYAFARRANWGDRRKAALDDLLRNLVIIEVGAPSVLNAYAEISTWLRAHGRPVGHNDRWIAATAKALDATVLTGDADFDPLHPEIITREFIDPKSVVHGYEE